MSENQNLLVRAAKILEIPTDVLAFLSHIEINGTNQVIVEKHMGILEYSENILILNLGAHTLDIQGHNLTITSMTDSALRLSGEIVSLQFNPV